jgi:hypothetical protein
MKEIFKIEESSESVLTGFEKIALDIALEKRKPENDSEKKLAEQIKSIEKKGHSVDIPSN